MSCAQIFNEITHLPLLKYTFCAPRTNLLCPVYKSCVSLLTDRGALGARCTYVYLPFEYCLCCVNICYIFEQCVYKVSLIHVCLIESTFEFL